MGVNTLLSGDRMKYKYPKSETENIIYKMGEMKSNRPLSGFSSEFVVIDVKNTLEITA